MVSEESHQHELQCLGLEVFRRFQELIEMPWANDEDTVIPSRRAIESEEERFRLWAQSMGLMQMGHASLDYRVRDSSIIKSSLADVLSELVAHLENLASIIFGNRPPVEQKRPADNCSNTTSSHSDEEISVSSSDNGSFHEADFRLASVVERLDTLYRLAAKIRNPRNRPQRPTKDLYKYIPESERAEYRACQEQIETALIAFVQQRQLLESVTETQLKVLDMSQKELLERYSSDTHWLVRRIGIANARRKQQFVYWERHAELLARDVTMKIPTIHKEAMAGVSIMAPTGKPARSVATSATKLVDARLTGPDDLKSEISHHSRVSTVVSPQGEKLAWPPAPHRLAGSKFFCCPYCKVLCPDTYLGDNQWRIHQIHDLQPYQCTYEDCPDPHRLYSQRQEWIDHENQHRRVWYCYTHDEEFETLPSYKQHVDDNHPGEDSSPELLAALVGSSLQPHRDCPLCPTAFSGLDHMRKHITYHLERLALFALPNTEQGMHDQTISGRSADSIQVVEHRGRRDSISGDFNKEEAVSFSEFLNSLAGETQNTSSFSGKVQDFHTAILELKAQHLENDNNIDFDQWISQGLVHGAVGGFGDELEPSEKKTRDGDEGATENGEFSKEIMSLLLDRRGDYITVTEDIVKAAAGSEWYGKELMSLLLDQRGDDFTVTEEVVKAAAGNERSGHEVMKLLLDRRGDEVKVTEDVIKAAAENDGSGEALMRMLLHQQGDGEFELQQVMETRKRVLGKEHPNTLTSMTNLAAKYWAQGQWKEATELEVQVVDITKRVFGEEHPDTLTSMANLAATYRNQEEWKEAEELEVRVMETAKRVHGEEHPVTLDRMANLATTYQNEKRWKDAEELQVRVVDIRKRVLGEGHPDTLTSIANLAATYWNQGQWKKAEELEVQVVDISKRVAGEEHPDTLTSIANLAATYWNQGRLKEAEHLEIQVIDISKRVFGKEHPNTITSIANLAATYRNQGRWKEAEELEVQVVDIRKKVLGDENPDTVTSMANLAAIYRNQERWKEAEELEVQVLDTRKRVTGEQNPDTLTSMANLAATYRKQERWKEAEELELQVVHTRKRVLGEEHPNTLTSMANLAHTWKGQNRLINATNLMRDCLELRQRCLGEDDPDTRSSLSYLREWEKSILEG